MARRAKPANGKAEVKRPPASKSPKDDGARVRDLEKRLTEALKREAEALGQLQTRDRELAEALEREAGAVKRETEALERESAASEILRVISSSPTDVQPVFDAILRSAVKLCNSLFGNLVRVEGDLVRL